MCMSIHILVINSIILTHKYYGRNSYFVDQFNDSN